MDNSSITGNLSGGAVRDQGLTVRRTLAPGTTESRPGFVTFNWPPRRAAKSAPQGAEGEKSGLRKLVARVRILDPAFSGRSSYYFLQSGLAALATVLVLPLLLLRANTFFATSLAATACVAFCMPRTRRSHPRYLIGGYCAGLIAGFSAYALLRSLDFDVEPTTAWVLFGGLAVGLATFLMVVLDVEHPPAVGVSLGLVVNDWDYFAVAILFAAVLAIVSAKSLLKSRLEDLL